MFSHGSRVPVHDRSTLCSIMPTVPSVPFRNFESYLERIEALRRDAEPDGFGTLAYLLGCAKLEAQNQADMIARDRANWKADPDDLWRSAD